MCSFIIPANSNKCGVFLPSGNGKDERVNIQWSWRECFGYLCAKVILPDGTVVDSFDKKRGIYCGYVHFSYGGRNYQLNVYREDDDEYGHVVHVSILRRG
jgi:hypothetical protein